MNVVYNPIFWKKQGDKLVHRITGKIKRMKEAAR